MHHSIRHRWFQQAPGQAGNRRMWLLVALLVAMLALVACGGAPPVATAGDPAATIVAGAADVTTTPTPLATRLPDTPTPVPPTSTATSTPTTAPSSTPQPTATDTVVPTATPIEIRPTPTLGTLDQEARSRLFDRVWQTVADSYLYSDFNGVDWQAAREEYRQRALDAPDAEHFYQVLKQMVALLDDRHSRYLSPQEAFQEQARTSGTDVRVGIGIAVDGDRIETVYGNSPAEEAGLRRRDQILTVDGRPFLDAPAALRGEAGTSVTIEVQAPGAEPRTLTVERRPVVQKIRPEAYRLPGTNIGYLLIQSFWADDMGEQVVAALNDLLATGDLDGLIVDLRGNGGGWRPVLEALLGTFVSGPVGEFYRQDQGRPLEARPNELQPRLATTPMVILVDQGSQSYAEVLPAALQAAGRAKIVGGRTAGNTETIFAHDFDDASRLWLAGEGFRLPSGANLEGSGVIPDVEIEADWLTFAEMDDPYIKKALELLHATGE